MSKTSSMQYNTVGNYSHLYSIGNFSHDAELSESNNTFKVTSGTVYASKPYKFARDWRISAPNEQAIFEQFMNDYKRFTGTKRLSKVASEQLNAFIANLIQSGRARRPIVYQRSTTEYSNRQLIKMTDCMANMGMIYNVIGKANEYQGNASFFSATAKFNQFSEREAIKIKLAKDASFLVLRDDDKNHIEIRKTVRNRNDLRSLSEPVIAYNELWTRHDAMVAGVPVIPFMQRIFKREKDLSLGGRWYGSTASHLQLKRHERKQILIDDCTTFEPDFKSLHYCLLYAWEGIQVNADFDPYTIDGFDRSTVKTVMFKLLNTKSVKRFINNVDKSANEENQALFKTDPKHPKLKGFIENVTAGTDGAAIYEAFRTKHSRIAHYFGQPDIGLKLQRLDSDIMATAILMLSALNIPVLPVHDSLVARVIDSTQVLNAMNEAYKKHTGFIPNISES